jgi:hypothetical protein
MKTFNLVIVALFVLVSAAGVRGQVFQTGDLVDHIDTIISEMPSTVDGGSYLQPNLASRILWRQIVDDILAGEYAAAHEAALTKNYQVVLFTDTENGDPRHFPILGHIHLQHGSPAATPGHTVPASVLRLEYRLPRGPRVCTVRGQGILRLGNASMQRFDLFDLRRHFCGLQR